MQCFKITTTYYFHVFPMIHLVNGAILIVWIDSSRIRLAHISCFSAGTSRTIEIAGAYLHVIYHPAKCQSRHVHMVPRQCKARKDKYQWANILEVLACISFLNVALTSKRHMQRSDSRAKEIYSKSGWKEQQCHKGHKYRDGNTYLTI